MKLNNLEVTLSEKDASMLITTEISQELAHDVEAVFAQMFGYYQYSAVTLKLSTPGGSLTALTAILQTMDLWRSKGRKVKTEACFLAASAGAMLLAMGDVGQRRVQPYSSLLFHHSRIGGTSSSITAGAAVQLASSLRHHDQVLVKRMVSHMSKGFGGPLGLAEEGAARCEMLRQNSTQIAMELDLPALGRSDRWLPALTKVYGDCRVKGSSDHYRRYIEQRLSQDSAMDIREAYGLCIIDGGYQVPLLVANAASGASNCLPEQRLKLAA